MKNKYIGQLVSPASSFLIYIYTQVVSLVAMIIVASFVGELACRLFVHGATETWHAALFVS